MNSIFSILYKDLKGVKHIGTGFLAYKHGLFVTAGHTFRKLKEAYGTIDLSDFRALFFIEDKPILANILDVYYKSFHCYEQRGPEYLDIAIGKVNVESIDYLKIDRRRSVIETELQAVAYFNTKPINNYGKDFSQLEEVDKVKIDSLKMKIVENDALITDVRSYYLKNRDEVPSHMFYNNCMTLENCFEITASGCPIIDSKNNVKGMLIGGFKDKNLTFALLSKYCSKSIQYKSPYLYNAYEYLE